MLTFTFVVLFHFLTAGDGNHQVWSLFILKLVFSSIYQVFIESANFPSECITDESDSSVIFSLMKKSACFSQCIVKPNQRLCFLQFSIDFNMKASRNPMCILIFAKNHVTHLNKSANFTLWMWRICSLINHRWTKSACFSHIQLQEKSYQKHFSCWFEF